MSCNTLEPLLAPERTNGATIPGEFPHHASVDAASLRSPEPIRSELGERVGEVRSMSETAQGAICLLATVLGLGAFFLQDTIQMLAAVPFGLIAIVCVAFALVAYQLALRITAFTERVEVFESGAVIRLKGKRTAFRYIDAEQLTTTKTDYETKHKLYLGSRIEMILQIAGRLRPLHFSLEARNGTRNDALIQTLIELTETAIQKHLMDRIESSGELRWTSDVSLTLDALHIHESPTRFREIPIEEIGHCDHVDQELRLFKQGDALPVLSLATGEPNFMPTFRIFQSLHQLYQATDTTPTTSVSS